MTKLYLAIPLVLLFSCGIPRNASHNMGDQNNAQALGDTGVTISRDSASDEQNDLLVNIGDKTISISYTDGGYKTFDSHGATLSEEDKAALKNAAEAFAQARQLSAASSAEDQITYKILDYLSYAPADYTFESERYNKGFALKNEGISCIKKNTIVKAEWNTQASGYVSEDILVGTHWPSGYGCMGRCGSDCGGWLPSSWTKDCLDHDACSYRNSASGGASDPNCGDEFNEAADDWTFGVIRGCRG
jgi:hypothetical protein